MPKLQTISTNFTAGVFSPKLRGRVDLEKYNSSLRDASNVVVLKQGGVTARPPMDYIAASADHTLESRIVPFVYSSDQSYVLEFSDTDIRVWKAGVLQGVLTGVNPYSASQLFEFDYVQSGDTLIMVHPDLPMKRLRRFSDTNWTVDDAPLDPGPIAEIGGRANIAITLSATTGASVTATAGSDFWRSADVGRTFTYLGGTATVTGVTSGTVATISISSTFSTTSLPGNGWLLLGSPLVALTPSAKDPVGQTVTLSGSATAFRSGDVGAYVSINGGLVQLTGVDGVPSDTETHDGDGSTTTFAYTFQILDADDITVEVGGVVQTRDVGLGGDYTLTGVGSSGGGTVVFTVAPAVGVANIEFSRDTGAPSIGSGIIIQELTSTTAAPADAWILKHPVWNAVDGYPSAVGFYQQRLWAGNTTRYPQSKWGSRSGLPFDFTPGPNDDDAVYKTIDSRKAVPIRFLHDGGRTMVTLTDSGEFEVRGGVEKPVTQTNFSAKKQSAWGCAATVKPEEIGENLLFAQRGGKVLRAIYALDVEGFTAKDISAFSDHLLEAGIAGMTFQQTPNSVLWCWLADGTMVACTFNTEQNVIAMVPCSTGSSDAQGYVESMCTVPEGDADMTYLMVRRIINGQTRRHLERFNWDANPGMDSRVTAAGGPTTWTDVAHLGDESVEALGDGVHLGTFIVSLAGVITTTAEPTTLVVGLPYEPSITLQDAEVGTGTGTAQGQATSVHRVTVRFFETKGCSVRVGDGTDANLSVDQPLEWETFGDDPLDGSIPSFTGDKDITEYGWGRADGSTALTLYQPQPYPWTVLAVIRDMTVNPG